MLMKTILILLACVFMSTGCDSVAIGDAVLTEGTYVGVFTRSEPNARYQTANVSISIQDGRFAGSSDTRNYPAICRGTFAANGRAIAFENECAFTADFDWTYILNGSFQLRQDRGVVTLTKSYGAGRFDTYTLTRN